MFLQVSPDLNYAQVLRISHESAVGSKQKIVADKSYYIVISMLPVITETCESGKCYLKQAEDRSGQILLNRY